MGIDTSKDESLTSRVQQSRIPGIAFALAMSALAVYAASQAPAMWQGSFLKAEQIQREDREHWPDF